MAVFANLDPRRRPDIADIGHLAEDRCPGVQLRRPAADQLGFVTGHEDRIFGKMGGDRLERAAFQRCIELRPRGRNGARRGLVADQLDV